MPKKLTKSSNKKILKALTALSKIENCQPSNLVSILEDVGSLLKDIDKEFYIVESALAQATFGMHLRWDDYHKCYVLYHGSDSAGYASGEPELTKYIQFQGRYNPGWYMEDFLGPESRDAKLLVTVLRR